MRFGPFSQFDIETLTAILRQNKAQFSVTSSPEDFNRVRDERKEQVPNPYPNYQGPEHFLYLEIEAQDVLLIRGRMENMGVIVRSESLQMLPELPEYFCPRCRHRSEHPSQCPRHRIDLVDFSSLVTEQRKVRSRYGQWAAWIVLLLAVMALIAEILSKPQIGHHSFF